MSMASRILLAALILAAGCRNIAHLQVNSDPAGAQVWLDHDSTGYVTDCLLADIYAGVHYLELRLGPLQWGEVLTLRRNETRVVNARFPELVWQAVVPLEGVPVLAVGPDGTVCVASGSNYLHGASVRALNPDGTAKWQCNLGTSTYRVGLSVADNNTVYALTDDALYALDPEGNVAWAYPLTGYAYGPALAADGTAYVYDMYEGSLLALTPAGQLRWSCFLGQGSAGSAPVIAHDGTIYVWRHPDGLYAVNPEGTVKWRYRPAEQYYYSSAELAVGPDSTVYVAGSNRLLAVRANGTGKWQTGGGYDYSVGSPAVGSDGAVYVQLNEYLYALSPAQGRTVWRYRLRDYYYLATSPALGSNGWVYANSTGLEAISSADSGNWRLRSSSGSYQPWSPAAITSDSLLYVAGEGTLYAVRLGAAACVSSWPMYRADPQRTGRAR